jgi:uncharacterized protein (TIGR03437 family)
MRVRISAVLIAAFACSALAQTYTIKTFAGGALPVNVAGLSTSLGVINGIAVDATGNVYLSLGDYNAVVRSDASTSVLTLVAGNGTYGFAGDGGPASSAQLANPAGIAFDAAGNLYIADAGNNCIREVVNGVINTIAGNGAAGYSGDNGPAAAAEFNGLGGIALDSAGNLYAADFYNQAIRKIAGGVITTFAGNGTYGYSGDGGAAASAQLAGPMGVAVDYTGAVYIAEAYNNRIRKVANGVISTYAGSGVAGYTGDYGPATQATLREPTDLAMDSLSNLYIADYGNNRVRMVAFSARPVITTVAGDGETVYDGEHVAATSAGLAAPQHVATDASGNLYIADGIRVRKVSHSTINTIAGGGVPTGENGPAVNAQLLSPQGVTLDSAGNVYIADEGTGRILKVSGGTLTRVAGTGTDQGSTKTGTPAAGAQLGQPTGVAVDAGGNVFLTDAENCRLLKVSGGVVSMVAGGGASLGDGGPAANAQLADPEAVAIDGGGNLYLADLDRIRVITNGVITTLAGNGTGGYQGDGAVATAAELSSPSGVAVDTSGNLYLADYANNRVRMVANGIITTFAGNGTYGFTGSGGNAVSAEVGYPAGVATDAAGNVYITDSYRVLKVTKGKTSNTITTIGGLNNPQGLAVDSAGNVYVAEPSTHRVRVLSPAAGTTCATTVTAANPVAPVAGGPLAIAIQTGTNCSWAIENLPAWITVQGNAFGSGAGAVTLAVAANPDVPRAATILAGGQSVVVGQAGAMTITGQVTSSSGSLLPGVTLTLSGGKSASAVSDSGGNFSFSGFSSLGVYTVTPSLAGYAFLPASQTFTNATSNPAANFTAWPVPQITGVGPVFGSTLVPAPSGFAAAETISIYGSNLCSTPAAIANPTLPDRLASCIVQVDGTNLHVYYAGAGQINAVLPQTLASGTHQLVVQRYTDTSYKTMAVATAAFSLPVNPVSMAFAERTDNGAQVLLVQNPDGSFAGSAKPVHAGDTVILYLTGLGKTAQTFAEGAAPKVASSAVATIQVTVQGLAAKVIYAGVQPQYPGIDQMNLQMPAYKLAAGQSTVTVQFSAPSASQTVSYQVSAQ